MSYKIPTLCNGQVEACAWPGGYPLLYVANDGGVLCPKCVQANLDLCQDPDADGWNIVGHDINWEDPALYCDHCNGRIESAYAEDEVEK